MVRGPALSLGPPAPGRLRLRAAKSGCQESSLVAIFRMSYAKRR